MIGFRNIAVHDYQELDLAVLEAIVTKHLGDFGLFIKVEVGGKGKGRSQFKDFSAEEKIVFSHRPDVDRGRIPLFLCGFLS